MAGSNPTVGARERMVLFENVFIDFLPYIYCRDMALNILPVFSVEWCVCASYSEGMGVKELSNQDTEVRPQFCQLSHRFVSLPATGMTRSSNCNLPSRHKISKCYHSTLTVHFQIFFKITFCGKFGLKEIFVASPTEIHRRGKNYSRTKDCRT